MPEEEVYIEASLTVLEQLRGLEPAERRVLVDELYRSLAASGRPCRLPGSTTPLYACWLGAYAFFYRELTRKELDHADQKFGYLLVDMKPSAQWISRQLGG